MRNSQIRRFNAHVIFACPYAHILRTHIAHPVTSRTYHHAPARVTRRDTDNARWNFPLKTSFCKHFFSLTQIHAQLYYECINKTLAILFSRDICLRDRRRIFYCGAACGGGVAYIPFGRASARGVARKIWNEFEGNGWASFIRAVTRNILRVKYKVGIRRVARYTKYVGN